MKQAVNPGEKNVLGRGTGKAESQGGTAGCVHVRTGNGGAGDKGKGEGGEVGRSPIKAWEELDSPSPCE